MSSDRNARRTRRTVAATATCLAVTLLVEPSLTERRTEPGRPAQASGSPRRSPPLTPAPETVGLLPPTAPQLSTVTLGTGPYAITVAEGEVLVRPTADLSPAGMEVLARAVNSRVLGHGARSGLYRLAVPPDSTLAGFQAALAGVHGIREALPNAVAVGTGCPTAEYRSKEWNLDRIDEATACASYAPGLSTVVVAVLDTGLAYESRTDSSGSYSPVSDLANVSVLPGYDFVNGDSHPDDDNQHGTHLAGIIAAAGKVVGTSPAVRILPVKVLDRNKVGTEATIVEGIYYAVDQGADVINLSLSFSPAWFPSSSLQDAVAYAADHGVVMVASAGNEGTWGIGYPAAFPDVISVGASRVGLADSSSAQRSYQAYYSNRGYNLDLLAPGGMINTDFNNDAWPDGVLAQTFKVNEPTNLGYWFMVGTSQATAHVSGAVAWLLADGANPAQIRSIMQSSADPMGLTQYDPRTGTGALRLEAARQAADAPIIQEAPPYYVNLLPRLVRTTNGEKAVVRLEVMDGTGHPAAGVRVGGSWMGSYTAFDALAVTDAAGVAQVSSGEIISSTGVAVGFRVDSVTAPGQRLSSRPLQFYSLSPASAELYSRLLEDPSLQGSVLLYDLNPSDTGLDGLIDRTGMVRSLVMKPLGAGLRSGALAVVLDESFAPELSRPTSGTAIPLAWNFQLPLRSGRGMVSQMTGTRIDAQSAKLGPAARYLLLPLDPAVARLDLAHYYPVLNAYASSFLATNRTFGNGFAASSMGNGFASSSMGNGFASSSLGDGFAASSMGNGFAASSMGNGFAASSMGNGFASSSMGNGFAASSMGNGFAASSMGNSEGEATAAGMSLLGSLTKTLTTTTTAVTGTVTSTTTAVVTTTTTVVNCVARSLPLFGVASLDEVNPCLQLIRTEADLEAALGEHHYP